MKEGGLFKEGCLSHISLRTREGRRKKRKGQEANDKNHLTSRLNTKQNSQQKTKDRKVPKEKEKSFHHRNKTHKPRVTASPSPPNTSLDPQLPSSFAKTASGRRHSENTFTSFESFAEYHDCFTIVTTLRTTCLN